MILLIVLTGWSLESQSTLHKTDIHFSSVYGQLYFIIEKPIKVETTPIN